MLSVTAIVLRTPARLVIVNWAVTFPMKPAGAETIKLELSPLRVTLTRFELKVRPDTVSPVLTNLARLTTDS